MSHTTRIRAFTFIHDGDPREWSNVSVKRDTWDRPVYIPVDVLFEFVAGLVRAQRMAELEQATPRQILGLPK